MKLLVIEDDPTVGEFVRRGLEEQRWQVDLVADGEEGERLAAAQPYDMVILDMRLPGKSGLEVLRSLRARGFERPVLVLTAQDAVDAKVQTLRAGADDYVTKPFDPLVLRARMRNALRRAAPARRTPRHVLLRFADCTCDPLARTVTHPAGRSAHLTEKEVQLFMALARRARAVVDRDELSRLLTGGEWSPLNRALDVHVSNLRRKLMAVMQADSVITSFRGAGYMLRGDVRFDE